MRAVALDVHRDFCEVAIVEEGRLRSAGQIETRPETLELFAQSLDARDWVALEVTGNAWAIARILEAHVARVIVVSPNDTGIRQARAKTDRLNEQHAPSALQRRVVAHQLVAEDQRGMRLLPSGQVRWLPRSSVTRRTSGRAAIPVSQARARVVPTDAVA